MLGTELTQTPPQQDPLATARLQQYQPVDGPTNRQLRFGLWWVEHQVLLRRLLIVFLAAVNLGVWVPSAYAWGRYAYEGFFADQALARAAVAGMPQNHAVVAAKGARAPQLGATSIFAVGGEGYEIGAEIRNPNDRWYATFEYSFDNDEWQRGYLLPNATVQLVDFVAGANRPSAVQPRLRNVTWRRIVPSGGLSVAELARERTDIGITHVTVTPVTGSAGLTRVAFTAHNRTAYNFWEADVILEARRAGRLVGLNRYTLSDLGSGEMRDVAIVWAGNLVGAEVRIIPTVDIFNERNYRAFDLGPGQIK